MTPSLLLHLAFWFFESVLLIVLLISLFLFFYIPSDPTETADRRFKIQIGSAFIAAAALGSMYGVLAIARTLGL